MRPSPRRARPASDDSPNRASQPNRANQRGERGASLLVALTFMTFVSIVIAGLFAAQWTSSKATPTMVRSRAGRVAGDNAMAAAVNWIKVNPTVGRDPAITGNDPCALNVTTPSGVITATCVGDVDSGKSTTATWPIESSLNPRTVTIITCVRGAGRTSVVTACDAAAGDRLLLRARVRFDVTTDDVNAPAANVPEVLSWKHLT